MLINFKLNSHIWLMGTVLDSVALELQTNLTLQIFHNF